MTISHRHRPVGSALTISFLALLALVGCSRAGDTPDLVEASVLNAQIKAGTAPLIVDVRTPGEFAEGHVPGAINIPHDQMPVRVEDLFAYKNQPVLLYCHSGRRSGLAAEVLRERKFSNLSLLKGDMPGWEKAEFSVERGEK